MAGTATGRLKGTDGEVEMIRALRAARRSAVKARAQAANQLKAMLITAPEGLKSELRALSTAKLVTKVSRFRPGTSPSDVETTTKFALRSVARRYQRLSEEISELDEQLAGSSGGRSRAGAARRGGRWHRYGRLAADRRR